jgi:mobilome CxxCx(11)CxxC protein
VSSTSDELTHYRQLAKKCAVDAFATSEIFQARVGRVKRYLLWVNYIGVAIPLLMGTIVLTFGIFSSLKLVVFVAGCLLLPQVVLNLWAVLAGWVDNHAYASASAAANDSLATRYRDLYKNPSITVAAIRRQYEVLQVEDRSRREQDLRQDISDAEKRMGMRAALRSLEIPCAGCDVVPSSMTPTDCGVCGNFKYKETKK